MRIAPDAVKGFVAIYSAKATLRRSDRSPDRKLRIIQSILGAMAIGSGDRL